MRKLESSIVLVALLQVECRVYSRHSLECTPGTLYSNPPVSSRHLILPANPSKDKTPEEESKTPNLCVFLHGALKVENMCALVELGEDWFGVVYSWSDNKKKSSLMLSLFEPGLDSVPWLGELDRLGPAADINETTTSPFPVKSDRKPSYSSGPVVWIKPNGIQNDIQKVLRHARYEDAGWRLDPDIWILTYGSRHTDPDIRIPTYGS